MPCHYFTQDNAGAIRGSAHETVSENCSCDADKQNYHSVRCSRASCGQNYDTHDCGAMGSDKNRPDPFPSQILDKATKTGFSFSCLFCDFLIQWYTLAIVMLV